MCTCANFLWYSILYVYTSIVRYLRKRGSIVVARLHNILNVIPLKDMSALLLNNAIMIESRAFLSSAQRVMLTDAISLADLLHKGAKRRTPMVGSNGKIRDHFTAYIEHPLRNTLRLIRLGVQDLDVIIATVLHDTVEDCAQKMADISLGSDRENYDEAELRVIAFEYIRELFGQDVEVIVSGVTNPLSDLRGPAYHPIYHEHVGIGIRDPRAFLVKYADLKDNALGLHFGDDRRMQRNLAKKYRPLFPILLGEWDNGLARTLLSESGARTVDRQLRGAETYLEKFLDE